jgi:hypothetical protein
MKKADERRFLPVKECTLKTAAEGPNLLDRNLKRCPNTLDMCIIVVRLAFQVNILMLEPAEPHARSGLV